MSFCLFLAATAPPRPPRADEAARPPARAELAREILASSSRSTRSTPRATRRPRRRGGTALKRRGLPAADVQVLVPRAPEGQPRGALPRARASASPSCCSRTSTWWRRCARTGRATRSSFVEKNGFFFGRGTADDKAMAAIFVANLLRYKREGFGPDRDLILALTADEEGGDANGVEFLLGIIARSSTPRTRSTRAAAASSRTASASATRSRRARRCTGLPSHGDEHGRPPRCPRPTTRSTGSPRRSAASRSFAFPVALNEVTRAFFERSAHVERAAMAAAMRALRGAARQRRGRRLSAARRYYNACCARRAWRRAWPAATPTTRCRRPRGERELPDPARRAPEEVRRRLIRRVRTTA